MRKYSLSEVSADTLARLNVRPNAACVLNMHENSEGHCSVSGWSGTGKSLVARACAEALAADYQDFSALSDDEWEAAHRDIFSRLHFGSMRTVIVDGFRPLRDAPALQTQLASLVRKGIRLIAFTQDGPDRFSDGFSSQAVLSFSGESNDRTVSCSASRTLLSGERSPETPPPSRRETVMKYAYTDAKGNQKQWSGRGRKPLPIAAALQAGKSLNDFLIVDEG